MADVNDDTDFNKARSILLTYSGIVLALWFFGARLTEFKLMGTEIHLEHRTNSVWLVLACLNVYFWFRCYQRLPACGRYFDKPMNDLYDKALIHLALLRHARRLRRQIVNEVAEAGEGSHVINGDVTYLVCHDELEEQRKHNGDEVAELHQIGRKYRTKTRIIIRYTFTPKHSDLPHPQGAVVHDYSPAFVGAWLTKGYAIAVGAFVTPWFTDYLAPLVLGCVSTLMAAWMWWQINYGGTSAIGL